MPELPVATGTLEVAWERKSGAMRELADRFPGARVDEATDGLRLYAEGQSQAEAEAALAAVTGLAL